MRRILADTGPIVGLIRSDDQWSRWSTEQAKRFQPPLLTCEIVIAEASYLVKGLPDGEQTLLKLVQDGYLQVSFELSEEVTSVRTLMSKYSDLPMSLADACLVRMSEIHDDAAVFTVDQDFLIYRKHGRKKIPLISPF